MVLPILVTLLLAGAATGYYNYRVKASGICRCILRRFRLLRAWPGSLTAGRCYCGGVNASVYGICWHVAHLSEPGQHAGTVASLALAFPAFFISIVVAGPRLRRWPVSRSCFFCCAIGRNSRWRGSGRRFSAAVRDWPLPDRVRPIEPETANSAFSSRATRRWTSSITAQAVRSLDTHAARC